MAEEKKTEEEKKKSDMIEVEKRIYRVGLMLRRKPTSFIVQYCADNWKVEQRQTYKYIRKARKEWQKYFTNVKHAGISYHIAQLRDLKDQAYGKKVLIGSGDNRQAISVADLGLVFEITKEEAKLMGIYPAERHKVDIPEFIKVKVDLTE